MNSIKKLQYDKYIEAIKQLELQGKASNLPENMKNISYEEWLKDEWETELNGRIYSRVTIRKMADQMRFNINNEIEE